MVIVVVVATAVGAQSWPQGLRWRGGGGGDMGDSKFEVVVRLILWMDKE